MTLVTCAMSPSKHFVVYRAVLALRQQSAYNNHPSAKYTVDIPKIARAEIKYRPDTNEQKQQLQSTIMLKRCGAFYPFYPNQVSMIECNL